MSFFFDTRTKPRRWSEMSVVFVYVVLAVLGESSANAVATGRSGQDQTVECGPYAVCDLASHFCDTVMNTCVRCSDDCHPGRINGDALAEEDCKRKCKVYYELIEEEKSRSVAKETTTVSQSILNHHRSDEKYLQLSVKSLNLINTDDNLTLTRVELLMAIETISIVVITFLLFIVCICLILLLHRQRIRTVHSYSPLDTGRKTASG